MKESRFSKWLFGETDVMENILEMDEVHDESREQQKREIRHIRREIRRSRSAMKIASAPSA